MHRHVRHLIFIFFVLTFVVTAPLVVLYTAGYRLNIANQRLQQTGVLAITTVPKGASIILNGQGLSQKSPYVIQRLMANKHDVIFQKKGYHDWQQKVIVEEGKTTYVTARLFANSQPQILKPTEAALALRSRPSANLITVDQASISFFNNNSNLEVRTGTGSAAELIALLPLGDYRLLEEDSDFILLANQRDTAFVVARIGGAVVELPSAVKNFDWLPDRHLLIWTDGAEVNTYDATTKVSNFITRDGESIIDVAWHPEADAFFVATAETISAYDPNVYETREVTPLLNSGTVAEIWLDAAGKSLYFLNEPLPTNSNQLPTVNKLILTL